MDQEKYVAYPAVWPVPMYRFGQSVIALCGNGECLSLVVGMRFGVFPDSLKIGDGLFWHRQQEWRYQIVEIENGVPQHCDGRWYPEAVLSEVRK